MDTRLKIATFGSITATIIAAVAIAMAPVGATVNGSWSTDEFEAKNKALMDVENKNYANVETETLQTAITGDVKVHNVDDQTGGAATGGASNMSESGTEVTASNTKASTPAPAPAPALPSPAVFEDFDDVELVNTTKTYVENKNKVEVATTTNQTAISGSVDIHCSDDVDGNLSTGDASNESSSTTTISLSN